MLTYLGLSAALEFVGVNICGADFGQANLPGNYGTDYIYNASSAKYFSSLGMTSFRLPFRWERLQRYAFAKLDTAEQNRLVDTVREIRSTGAAVIVEPQNFARYFGQVISPNLDEAFVDFWIKVATLFKNDSRVFFELVNEPHDLSSVDWRNTVNKVIAGIRKNGAPNLILIPGVRWTGAWAWNVADSYGPSNSNVMKNVVDPLNNFAFSVHQYFDSDYSGTSATCVRDYTTVVDITTWLKQNNYTAFLTELAAAYNTDCRTSIISTLDYLETHKDVWRGWNWWAAGIWWHNYMYSIQPIEYNGNGGRQLEWLIPYLETDWPLRSDSCSCVQSN